MIGAELITIKNVDILCSTEISLTIIAVDGEKTFMVEKKIMIK